MSNVYVDRVRQGLGPLFHRLQRGCSISKMFHKAA